MNLGLKTMQKLRLESSLSVEGWITQSISTMADVDED